MDRDELREALDRDELNYPRLAEQAGPESIDGTAGATASTVHVRVRGADVLPSVSIARTWNVCEPSVRFV